MVPTEFSHYRVLSPLGHGGMGEVYLAEDQSLGRKVALKFLLPAAGDDSAHQRLLREARAAAHLDHPFICKVYEVGEHDGRPFLAMEYVDGVTLRDRLADGGLPAEHVVRVGREIAEALHFAHERGVVHRDVKPANVMVTRDGHVKVMDFGIAKRLAPAAAADAATASVATLTIPGELTGTLAYMSPEQVRGESVDGRSDVFAFGVLLHELITGTNPFLRSSVLTTAQAILTESPPPLEARVPGSALPQIVARCLAKDRTHRYQSLRDVRRDLDGLTTGAGLAAPASPRHRKRWMAAGTLLGLLALTAGLQWLRPWSMLSPEPVLAFRERDWIVVADFNNLTGDAVFDGSLRLALEVALAQSQFVNVYPRTRIAAALGRMQRDPAERLSEAAASEVAIRDSIRGVLACDIAQLGAVYSITARVIDPQSKESVLTDSITARTKDEVLGALDDLAKRVRANLGESIGGLSAQSLPLPQVTTSSLEALKLFAEAQKPVRGSDPSASNGLLREAVALDPEFALAHAELGRRYYLLPDRETRKAAEAHFTKALALTDRLSLRERLWVQAVAEDSRGRREEAAAAYKTYLAQYPDDAAGWFRLAWTQMATLRQYSEAVQNFKKVIALNPSDANAYVNLATSLHALDDLDAAIPAYQKAFSLSPGLQVDIFVNHEYGFTLVDAGKLDEARSVFEQMIKEAPSSQRARGFRSRAFLEMFNGRYDAATADLRQAILLNQTHRMAVSEYRDRLNLIAALEATGQTAAAATEWAALNTLMGTLSLSPEWLMRPAHLAARRKRVAEAARFIGLMQKTLGNSTADSSMNRNTSRDHAFVQLAQGDVELARGQTARAIELIEPAHATLLLPDSLDSIARAYAAAGRVPEAVTRYEELLERRPFGNEAQDVWFGAHVDLGQLYERLGRTDDARRLYTSLLDRWKGGDRDIVLRKAAQDRLARLARASGG